MTARKHSRLERTYATRYRENLVGQSDRLLGIARNKAGALNDTLRHSYVESIVLLSFV